MITHLDNVIQSSKMCVFKSDKNKRSPFLHTYYIENTLIKEFLSATYPGVTIDSKLTWNDHIQRILTKSMPFYTEIYITAQVVLSAIVENLLLDYIFG